MVPRHHSQGQSSEGPSGDNVPLEQVTESRGHAVGVTYFPTFSVNTYARREQYSVCLMSIQYSPSHKAPAYGRAASALATERGHSFMRHFYV